MEKYLLLKLGMNASEVEKVLEQKITLKLHKPDLEGFYYLNNTMGTYLSFTEDKILKTIMFGYPFSVAVDGIKISMNMNEVEKIKGLPEKIVTSDDYPEKVHWFYFSKDVVYYFKDNKIYCISFADFNGTILTNEDIDKNNEIKIANNMEKYPLLKLGMNISEVEKVLDQKITLKRHTHKPDSKGFYYHNYSMGTSLHFTEDKILKYISFDSPFSVAVDGIKIGMNMKEVEKIKGLPDLIETSDDYPEMVDWFYFSKDIAYDFEDNKVYSISFSDFNGTILTNEDIDKLINAADGVYKIENDNIENGDVIISSSFDSDVPNEIKNRK